MSSTFTRNIYRPEHDDPANPPLSGIIFGIDTRPSTQEEVKIAIKAIKSSRAPGIDDVHSQMLTADISSATKVFIDPFR